MTILNDKQIRELGQRGCITPFVDESVRYVDESGAPTDKNNTKARKVISYGNGSFGYDVRLANNGLAIFRNKHDWVYKKDQEPKLVSEIDPKNFDPDVLVIPEIHTSEDGSKYVLLPGNSYLLGYTPEVFNLPRDVIVHCLGKSTYARAAVSVNITPIEPEFEGQVVIEVSNHCGLPVRIYLNEGIAQFAFFKGEECETSYADKDGKYMNQRGLTLPKV